MSGGVLGIGGYGALGVGSSFLAEGEFGGVRGGIWHSEGEFASDFPVEIGVWGAEFFGFEVGGEGGLGLEFLIIEIALGDEIGEGKWWGGEEWVSEDKGEATCEEEGFHGLRKR